MGKGYLGKYFREVRCVVLCLAASVMVRLLATPWTVARQGTLSMGFSRQEY